MCVHLRAVQSFLLIIVQRDITIPLAFFFGIVKCAREVVREEVVGGACGDSNISSFVCNDNL